MTRKNRVLGRVGRRLWLLSPLLIVACAAYQEPDNIRFGESVRDMIALQTADPDAGARGLDGEKAERAFSLYRRSAASPTAAEGAAEQF